jgi:hypothetical protein
MPSLFALIIAAFTMAAAPNGFAARLRFWDAHGDPLAVVAYRVYAPGAMERVHLTVVQWDPTSRQRADSTWTQPAERAMGSTESVAGVVVLARVPALVWWQLRATRENGDSLTAVERHDESPLDAGNIAMSDLALGTERNSVRWLHDGIATAITLSDTIGIHDTLHVTYQVNAMSPRARVRTTLTFTNITDPKHGEIALRTSFDGALTPGVNDFDREIDLSHLRQGRYRLELQAGDLDGGGVSVRAVQFYLR